MYYVRCTKCRKVINPVYKCDCETAPSEVSSTGVLSGDEVERLFLLAIINTFNTDQVAAVTKYYVEELRPNAKKVLARFQPDNPLHEPPENGSD